MTVTIHSILNSVLWGGALAAGLYAPADLAALPAGPGPAGRGDQEGGQESTAQTQAPGAEGQAGEKAGAQPQKEGAAWAEGSWTDARSEWTK